MAPGPPASALPPSPPASTTPPPAPLLPACDPDCCAPAQAGRARGCYVRRGLLLVHGGAL